MQGLVDKEAANVDSPPSEQPTAESFPFNTPLPKQQNVQSKLFKCDYLISTF
jgi:hypothetical protein